MRAYLALCRFPAVFTAASDIFLGYALTAGPGATQRFWMTLLASAGIYLGGMVLNDILDEAKDREERPERPIPSGRVSKRSAWMFYTALTGIGLGAAALVSWLALWIAVALAGLVWLYDGPLKKTILGPFVMGACRSGNIMLAASAGLGTLPSIMAPKVLWVAAAMGIYIAGLTWFGRQEASKPKRSGLLLGWVLVNAGLMAGVTCAGWHRAESATSEGLVPMILLVILINYRLSTAIVTPSPKAVQSAMRTMLLSIPIWNGGLIAILVGASGVTWAIAAASLFLPATLMGRVLKLT